jgi:hypothetical protein
VKIVVLREEREMEIIGDSFKPLTKTREIRRLNPREDSGLK